MMVFLLLAVYAIGVTAADDGDDFSNNLFSDLAPLLALFGERVTMQSMSQSMGWADNIILAMAPIGIITTIICAIRVGDPSWLKAIIGRARENLAVAELELMSSTSNEVCEMWNGQQMIRSELTTASDLNVWKDFSRWRESQNSLLGSRDNEKYSTNLTCPEVIVLRHQQDKAPNISLNSHNQFWRGELRAAAGFGIMLQLEVLMYSGLATYHPALKFSKDGSSVIGYAYPFTASGTLLLMAGMLICPHVVESSTNEQRFQPRYGEEVRMVWLQQMKTVSDQVFDSFAVFAKDPRAVITTSERAINDPTSESPESQGKKTPYKNVDQEKRQNRTQALVFQTVVGTMISLCGFVVQFVGLREMHWSASLIQLGAVLLMTCLRALVRRGLAKSLGSKRLVPGYELDWFALTLGDPQNSAWHNTSPDPRTSKKDNSKRWRVLTGKTICKDEAEKTSDAQTEGDGGEGSSPNQSEPSRAHQMMVTRKKLGRLMNWRGPASAEAISLARAIEITMDTLDSILPYGMKTWKWSVRTRYEEHNAQLTSFCVERRAGKWKAHADELEAALSLWLHTISEEDIECPSLYKSQSFGDQDDDSWLRAKEPSAKQSLRILGPYDLTLLRDLRWWLPKDDFNILEVSEKSCGDVEDVDDTKDLEVMEFENQRVVDGGQQQLSETSFLGLGACSTSRWQTNHALDIGEKSRSRRIKRTNSSHISYASEEERGNSNSYAPSDEDEESGSCYSYEEIEIFLAATSNDSPKLLYAQDMFTTFMWAVTTILEKPVQADADIHPNDAGDRMDWRSFKLQNKILSDMVHGIHDTGLGTLPQIQLSIIPPLSYNSRLPQPDSVIELARQQARPHEHMGDWKKAADIYLWLFHIASTFPEDSGVFARATAVVVELLRQVVLAIDLRDHQGDDFEHLEGVRREVVRELQPFSGIASSFMRLYERQSRRWKCPIAQEQSSLAAHTVFPETFKYTIVHDCLSSEKEDRVWRWRDIIEMERGKRDGRVGYDRDIHGWTPLHYSAVNLEFWLKHQLAEIQSDVNAQDLAEWTPLHYFCGSENDHEFAFHFLLQEGADINAQGRDGVTPLHCAVKKGNINIAKVLVETGAAIDVPDSSGMAPLMWAAYQGHDGIVRYLHDGANMKLRDRNGRTVLHILILSDRVKFDSKGEIAGLLIKAGADQDAKDRKGQAPLHYAILKEEEDTVCQFLENRVDKEVKDGLGTTPLQIAAKRGMVSIVNLLIRSGAQVESKDMNGCTPLILAAEAGHDAAVKVLLDEGANVMAQTVVDRTPLHVAAESGSVAAMALLLDANPEAAARRGSEAAVGLLSEKGAWKNAQDEYGQTPLHLAAVRGHAKSVERLIEEMCDLEARNDWVGTALHLAAQSQSGQLEVIKQLIGAGANKKAKSIGGQTPLDIAVKRGLEDITQLLRSNPIVMFSYEKTGGVLGPTNIRLLHLLPATDINDPIESRIEVVSLEENPAYEALSYCWGENNQLREIKCNQQEFQVTENLFSALQHLRNEHSERTLWIDAICINQKDLEERQSQVLLMEDIYTKSERVVVWLGPDPASDGVNHFFELIQSNPNRGRIQLTSKRLVLQINLADGDLISQSAHVSSSKVPAEQDYVIPKEAQKGAVALLKRPWWTRVWTVQELILAPTAIFMCGNLTASSLDVRYTWAKILEKAFKHGNNAFETGDDDDLDDLRELMFDPDGSVSIAKLRLLTRSPMINELGSLLRLHRWLKAKDPRDKVYGSLGIAASTYGIKPDYTVSTVACYTRAAFSIICGSHSLEIFSCLRRPSCLETTLTDLPSWVPDWSYDFSNIPDEARGPNSIHNHVIGPDETRMDAFLTTLMTNRIRLDADRRVILDYLEQNIKLAYEMPKTGIVMNQLHLSHIMPKIYRIILGYKKVQSLDDSDMFSFGESFTNIQSAMDQRMATTGSGYLCLVPWNTQPGDRIALLQGGGTPYVLRKAGKKWRILADCYVHGIMSGEAWSDDKCVDIEII
ncbi:hypothetical protein FSARC_2654 [Fusarium sarcochroum]|uniref:Heterokaryon incompatibility domain-containing protein n=1 Tax=Fusarium sarcochroum TaxID=1208366 RepID=A0A8H4XDJ7_9HYPO|nr:hypothetical protein FSARC_2654 [Fusarium sarcochroum]